MKKLNAIIAGLIVLAATGCGNPDKKVSVRNVDIYGSIVYNEINEDINKYITIDDGTYNFSINDDILLVDVQFKKTNSIPEDIKIKNINDAYLTPLDKEGNNIVTTDNVPVEMKIVNIDDLKALIEYTWTGNYKRLTFKFALLGDKDVLNKINSFKIDLDIDYMEKELDDDTSSSSSVSNTSSSNSSSASYSDILDEYEKYVKQLKSVFKKASKGDLSAITEYASLLEKAESLGKKLENLEDNMSSKDLDRMESLENSLLDLLDVDLDLSGLEDALDFF